MSKKKTGLGKGLEALFVDNGATEKDITTLEITEIEPNREQPRKIFDEGLLKELSESIKKNGVLQPIIVRKIEDKSGYQIVAGERRFRASKLAGLTNIPVIIKDFDDKEAMQVAMIENLQRENLDVIEEAMGYKVLLEEYDFTQEDVAKTVGKSRPAIANALRLLSLPKEVMVEISNRRLSAGHGKALLSLTSQKEMIDLAQECIKGDYSVRKLERICFGINDKKEKDALKRKRVKNPFFKEIEDRVRQKTGRKAKVLDFKRNKGKIEIDFFGEEDLMKLAEKLAEV